MKKRCTIQRYIEKYALNSSLITYDVAFFFFNYEIVKNKKMRISGTEYDFPMK